MARGISQIHVHKNRGKITVQAMGVTARGQRYLKEGIPLVAKKMSDPAFKEELKTAVDKILERTS